MTAVGADASQFVAQRLQARQQFRLRRRQFAQREDLQHDAHALDRLVEQVELRAGQGGTATCSASSSANGEFAQRVEADRGRGAAQRMRRLQRLRRPGAQRFLAPAGEVAASERTSSSVSPR
jgi:hypothetical protein